MARSRRCRQDRTRAKNGNVEYKSGIFPIRALGRARASMDISGMIKILADKKTDEILGVHDCPKSCRFNYGTVTAMEYRASAEDLLEFATLATYTEAIKEAALAATDDRHFIYRFIPDLPTFHGLLFEHA